MMNIWERLLKYTSENITNREPYVELVLMFAGPYYGVDQTPVWFANLSFQLPEYVATVAAGQGSTMGAAMLNLADVLEAQWKDANDLLVNWKEAKDVLEAIRRGEDVAFTED
jgi:hypothetical protein